MGFIVKAVKKVIKPLAIVAGIALAIPTGGASLLAVGLGVSAGVAAAIAGGLAIGAALLSPRPKAPDIPRESIDRLQANIDPRTPRKIVFGHTAMATDIRDYEYTGNQDYLHQFIVVAAHKVQSIDQIWLNEKLAWTASGGAQGEYAGYLTVATRTEGTAANAINISPRMGTTRRYTGCAYVHLRYKMTGNGKKAESPFAGGAPTKMVIRGRGASVYDPRLDSTVPGGSGPQRANNQATWAWSDNASRNPALQLLWYLLGWRINGKLSVGCGIPADRIDLESFITAANLCDEQVMLAGGGFEPRYRSDGVGSDGIGPITFIDMLKATMNADLDDVDGKLRLTVFHNDLADPVADFDDHDMIEGFVWNQTPDLSDMFNIVRGSYVNADDIALYQMGDYPEVALPSRDGIERVDTFDLAFVQSPSQAQRLAKQRLQRQQYGGTFETTLNARGWLGQKNAVVRLSCRALGWTNKLFRIAQMEHRVDGTCPVVLREENSAIYAWDRNEASAVVPAEPTEYDYTLDPFYQGLVEAGEGTNVIWTKSASTPPLPAPSAGVPPGWFETSADLPAGALPIWTSFGKIEGAVFVWQAPILSATDTRYWDAIDANGVIKTDKVDNDSIQDSAVDTDTITEEAISVRYFATKATSTVIPNDSTPVDALAMTMVPLHVGSDVTISAAIPVSGADDISIRFNIIRSYAGGGTATIYTQLERNQGPGAGGLSSTAVLTFVDTNPLQGTPVTYTIQAVRSIWGTIPSQSLGPFTLFLKEEKR